MKTANPCGCTHTHTQYLYKTSVQYGKKTKILENKEKVGSNVTVYYLCANKLNTSKIKKDELFLK